MYTISFWFLEKNVLTKNHVKQVKWNQLIKTEGNLREWKNFCFIGRFKWERENLLKGRASEICVKQILKELVYLKI